MSTSEFKRIPGRKSPESFGQIQNSLNEKYHNVLAIGGRVTIGEPVEKKKKGSDKYYEVDVKLLFNGKEMQQLVVGIGEDDKDTKGAYEHVLSMLGVKVPSSMKEEREIRQLAHNEIAKKYNSIEDVAIVNETTKGGKATVEVNVKKGSVVARGTGVTEDKAYDNILRA